MTTSPVHRQPLLTALLLSMVASMGDHQGHSALPTAGARCECFRWMRVGNGRCPNSFRATGDNSTSYAGPSATTTPPPPARATTAATRSIACCSRCANGDAVRVALACAVETVMHTRERYGSHTGAALTVRAARQMGSKLNAIVCAVALEEQLADAERSRRSERRAVIMPAQDVMPVRGGHARLFWSTSTAPRMFMLRQDLSR